MFDGWLERACNWARRRHDGPASARARVGTTAGIVRPAPPALAVAPPVRTILAPPRAGHSLAAWGPDAVTAITLAAVGECGALSFRQSLSPRNGMARVCAFWAYPERITIAAGRDAMEVRESHEAAYLRTGHRDFDAQMAVRGTPAGFVTRFLDADTRGRLLELAYLAGGPGRRRRVRLEAHPGQISLTLARRLGNDAPLLDRFLSHAVLLLRRLRESPDLCMELLGYEEVAAEARCPVCAEAVAGRLFRCDRCRTFHHAECFEYAMGCAVYACRSARGTAMMRPGPTA